MSTRKRSRKDINDAVRYFINAKTKLKFKGNDALLQALELIETTATTVGLSTDHITALLDVAACGLQVDTVNRRLIKALIPATVVSETAVLKVVAWLCTRKPSISIQGLLLRWVLVVYDFIDTMDNIHTLYGILFHFLHYRTLMPYVCHLLYLLTRKEDVKLFRVRMLIQYQRDMGSQLYLTGLLSIYRHYYPNLVHIVVPRSYKSFFPTLDRKWCALVREVRGRVNPTQAPDITWERALAERLYPSGQNIDLVPSRKRRKVDPIPVLHSLSTKSNYHSDRLESLLGLQKVPFVHINSFKDVLNNIDSIEFPSQIGAVLRSNTLRHLMSYTKDPVAAARFQFWVGETLQEELVDGDRAGNRARVTDLLQQLKVFSEFLQEGVPAVDAVLSEYLQTWNGLHYAPLVFKLLARCRMYSFEKLSAAFLDPLRKLFFMSSVYFKCKVIMCLTDMLRNFAATEWPRYQDLGGQTNEQSRNTYSCLCLFSKDMGDLDGVDVILKFIAYVSRMLLIGAVAEKHHALLELCILDFLDVVSTLHKRYRLPFVVLVEPRLFEQLFISGNPVTVARICTVICQYKNNFSSLKSLQKTGEVDVVTKDGLRMITACNQLILDFCNTLWRSKAYTTTDKLSVFHFDPRKHDRTLQDVPEMLSVFRHPAFLGYVKSFLEGARLGPSCDPAVIKNYKRDYLQHLLINHMDGISDFISTFIRVKAQ